MLGGTDGETLPCDSVWNGSLESAGGGEAAGPPSAPGPGRGLPQPGRVGESSERCRRQNRAETGAELPRAEAGAARVPWETLPGARRALSSRPSASGLDGQPGAEPAAAAPVPGQQRTGGATRCQPWRFSPSAGAAAAVPEPGRGHPPGPGARPGTVSRSDAAFPSPPRAPSSLGPACAAPAARALPLTSRLCWLRGILAASPLLGTAGRAPALSLLPPCSTIFRM